MTTQALHRSSARRSTGRDAATGLVSLIGLVVLVVAIPVLLVSFIGWPLPTEMPSFGDITDALGDRYVPDRFVVGALACVCWLIWVELVASVVVETFAYVRGEKAADVPLAGGMQKFVGRLIGGVALLIAAFMARGETPDAVKPLVPAQPTPIAELASIDIDLTLDPVSGHAGSAVETLPTHTVVPRDTLWEIAETTLGDPMRWSEIWELNANRDMGSGRVFQDPDLILPGWELFLPADALVAGADEAPVATPTSDDRSDDAEDTPTTSTPDKSKAETDGNGGDEAEEHAQGLGDGMGGEGFLGSAGTGRVEVLEPLDAPVSDGPNGGVIAGPRVETLDPVQAEGDLADDDGSQEETTSAPVDD